MRTSNRFSAESPGGTPPGPRCLTVAALAVGLGTTQFATAFWQVPDEPSPASGTAQVIAQGVVDIQDGDVRWQITEGTAPPPANATESRSDLGFLIVDSGVLLAEDVATGEQHRLPPGEAMLTLGGAEQVRAALGSEPAVYRSLALVDADAHPPADDSLLFASEPFPGPGARHDMDLLRDALGPSGDDDDTGGSRCRRSSSFSTASPRLPARPAMSSPSARERPSR